ncbi:MAG: CoA pyrophosphatase [Magnetococcus sp. DMHC-6]
MSKRDFLEYLSECLDRFQDEEPFPTPQSLNGRISAAVLVPLLYMDGEWRVLFIQRSQQVSVHRGQMAFPGGHCELTDLDERSTALRETEEELGIKRAQIQILGQMERQPTHQSGFLIRPVVGRLTPDFFLSPDPKEVAQVVTLPLAFFLNKEACRHSPKGVYYLYGEHHIWGATAAIMQKLALRLQGIVLC